MPSTRTIQFAVTGLVAGLVALLFFSGKNNSSALMKDDVHANAEAQFAMPAEGFDFKKLEEDIKQRLTGRQRSELEALEEECEGQLAPECTVKLAEKYDSMNQPALAGYYYQKAAEEKPAVSKYWFLTGKKFFEAQGTVQDSVTFAYFVNLSSNAYEKALKLDPSNLDAKADQAVNLIEGKGLTMQGVGMLKEIEQVQPDNRRALFYLGVLSIQSGQYDKAVNRFSRLAALGAEGDNNYPYYFRYLGQAYASLGQNDKALEAFRQYKQLTMNLKDQRPHREAEQLIKSIQ